MAAIHPSKVLIHTNIHTLCTYTHVCTHTYTHTCTNTHKHACTLSHSHTHTRQLSSPDLTDDTDDDDDDDDKLPEDTLMPGAEDNLEGSTTKYLQDEVVNEDAVVEAPPLPPMLDAAAPLPPPLTSGPDSVNLELHASSTGASVAETKKKEPKYIDVDQLLLGVEPTATAAAAPESQVKKDPSSVVYVKVKPSAKVPKVRSEPVRAGRGELGEKWLQLYAMCIHIYMYTRGGTILSRDATIMSFVLSRIMVFSIDMVSRITR